MPTIQPGGPPNVFKLADVLPAIRSFEFANNSWLISLCRTGPESPDG